MNAGTTLTSKQEKIFWERLARLDMKEKKKEDALTVATIREVAAESDYSETQVEEALEYVQQPPIDQYSSRWMERLIGVGLSLALCAGAVIGDRYLLREEVSLPEIEPATEVEMEKDPNRAYAEVKDVDYRWVAYPSSNKLSMEIMIESAEKKSAFYILNVQAGSHEGDDETKELYEVLKRTDETVVSFPKPALAKAEASRTVRIHPDQFRIELAERR